MAHTVSHPILEDAARGRLRVVGFTVEQYDSFIESGKFAENTATELIDGLIVQKDRSKSGEDPMTVGDRHRMAVLKLQRLLPQFEALGCFLQSQQPIVLPPDNEPEPDISVIRGMIENYADRKPAPPDVLLVLEVADSSLNKDLSTKLRIYAAAGIPKYVVVDLVNNVVIVHAAPHADSYTNAIHLVAGENLQLSAGGTNHVDIAVSQLL